jgi:flagellar hook protein FlgE
MSFEIALSAVNAINSQLDTISNNIANSGTYGFKSSRANFASMYAGTQPNGTVVSSLTQSVDIGGSVLTTGRGLDAAILGRGYFVSRDDAGQSVYSRVGIFSVDQAGYVVDGFKRRVQGYGAVTGSAALGALGDLSVPTGQVAAMASTKLAYVANLSAEWTVPTVTPFASGDTKSYNSSTVSVAYDSLGVKYTVTQYFVKTGTSTVDVHYAFDGATVAGPATPLAFDTNGKLTSTPTVALALGTPAGAAALAINIDYTGTTQYAGEATNTTNAVDGYASGTMTSVQISDDGSLVAQYSNGQQQKIGTIALATFPDEGELTQISDTSWTSSNTSGTALYSTPGSGMAGSLTAGALEQSNVEMTGELVDLMSAQRNYQANTKVITAQNEMMQTLMQAV